jgi:uncharacterized protein (TIGR03437 family)
MPFSLAISIIDSSNSADLNRNVIEQFFMRWNRLFLSMAAALCAIGAPALAATFGTVVPIGGHASDLALDESRGLLYVANFTANRIEVMSTSDFSIQRSMNVAPQPAALSLSPDNQYLLVAHFGNLSTPDPSRNAITLINLATNARQTFTTGDVPLSVAFMADNTALVVTTSGLWKFDPLTGNISVLSSFQALAKSLTVDLNTFPTQVILAATSTSPDLKYAYGVADDGQFQAFYRYDLAAGRVYAVGVTASPKPLPRVAVAADGSWAMVGQYKIDANVRNLAQFPNSTTSANIGGVALDSKAGLIYAQILTASPAAAPASGSAASSAAAAPTTPTLSLLDADNLYERERLNLPENITGRMTLTSRNDVLYAVTDSGVTVMPVGRLRNLHRISAVQSDLFAGGSFCNRNAIVLTLNMTDPGGGNTDFSLSTAQGGVTFSPASGVTPAVVKVKVDPNAFQNQNGTLAVPIAISSSSAINQPAPVRLLINNRNPDQRGTALTIPGVLTDILADPVRNRFYVVQQDRNQILVFDGGNYQQIATLRTSTTPTQMAFTFDRKYLIVGHDNSQFAYVYDLDTLQPDLPIEFPAGHYPRSIAESGKSILAVVRNVASSAPGVIDRIDFAARKASPLTSLGIYTNSVSADTVLAPAPNGGAILAVGPDGNVLLYDANADTFTVSRKDFQSLGGAYAASSYNSYVVGDKLLNASLVPQGKLNVSSGTTDGFAFIDQAGLRTMLTASANPGSIEHFTSTQNLTTRPTRTVEAPLGGSRTQPFIRSLAPLADRSAVVSLTISGLTVLPWNYDAAVAPPSISAVVNAADGNKPVAPGGLISIYGANMAPVNMATRELPLPTAIAESCLMVNGIPLPMLFVSGTQINGQLPFNVDGNAVMSLHTPGGVSDNFNINILPAAPSVFRSASAGPVSGLATIVRADNGELITPTNPIHYNDTIVIYATGLGRTSPAVDSGLPAPDDQLAWAVIPPSVTLGGKDLNVLYAGLVPGSVGLYQINATVPGGVQQGMEVPLVISQSGTSTTLAVRVVK